MESFEPDISSAYKTYYFREGDKGMKCLSCGRVLTLKEWEEKRKCFCQQTNVVEARAEFSTPSQIFRKKQRTQQDNNQINKKNNTYNNLNRNLTWSNTTNERTNVARNTSNRPTRRNNTSRTQNTQEQTRQTRVRNIQNNETISNTTFNFLRLLKKGIKPAFFIFVLWYFLYPIIVKFWIVLQLKQGWIDQAIDKNLTNTNFQNAQLSSIDLQGSNLAKANLIGANLQGTNLRNTDIGLKNISQAQAKSKLSPEDFTAKLDQEDLLMWEILNKPMSNRKLQNQNLSYFFLGKSTLRYANLIDTKMKYVVLTDSDLEGAAMRRINLTRSNLRQANLNNANLSQAKLVKVKASLTTMRNTNLKGANLEWIDLTSADLQNANLKGANLKGANFYGSNRHKVKTDSSTTCPNGMRGPCW